MQKQYEKVLRKWQFLFYHNINVKEVFDAGSMVRTLIDNGLVYVIFDHFWLVRSKHARVQPLYGEGRKESSGTGLSYRRQLGRVVRAWSWVQIMFGPRDDVSPEFNFSTTLVNSQLVCLPPVGILNLVMFIYHHLFTLVLKRPNGEWPISYTYIRYRKICKSRDKIIEIIPKRFPEKLLKNPWGFIRIAWTVFS